MSSMNARVTTLLGYARRAGKVVSGETAVEAALKKGRPRLLVVAADQNEKAIRKWQLWCADQKVPCVITGYKNLLGQAIGCSPRSVIAITDEQMAAALTRAASQGDSGG